MRVVEVEAERDALRAALAEARAVREDDAVGPGEGGGNCGVSAAEVATLRLATTAALEAAARAGRRERGRPSVVEVRRGGVVLILEASQAELSQRFVVALRETFPRATAAPPLSFAAGSDLQSSATNLCGGGEGLA